MGILIILIVTMFLFGCNAPNENIAPGDTKRQSQTTPIPTPTQEQIGYFSTKILDKEEDRVNNLKICAHVLDGHVVSSGDTFSFNDAVGMRTRDKGYEEARILIDGKKGYAVGGGVCQISSTIYNAVLAAGLETVERHDHDRDVHYVPRGQDAAVSYGTLDFKFKTTCLAT